MPPKPPKPPLTHFLCLPLISDTSRPHFDASLSQLGQQLGKWSVFGKDGPGRALRPVGSLHLTLGVMSLREQGSIDGAAKFLQELDLTSLFNQSQEDMVASSNTPDPPTSEEERSVPTTSDSTRGRALQQPGANEREGIIAPLKVSMSSLGTMRSARSTTVLYTSPIDTSNRLLPFCTRVRYLFTKEGFMIEDTRPLKLHATILNTVYSVGGHQKANDDEVEGQGSKTPPPRRKRRKAPLKFDAQELLEQFDGFTWAENVTLKKLAICKMGAEKIKDEEGNIIDERYEEVAVKELF
ncbi:MAG: hypothetical protein M1831_001475 [Alyxoria varia]|nr:MAG: hypothetical protein M1831_001475 [Alyxoria varia]